MDSDNDVEWVDNVANMSLRDWFAGQALSGLVTFDVAMSYGEAAKLAYMHADAMLAERTKDASKDAPGTRLSPP